MQKWLMTIRSFNMLANHKNKEARNRTGLLYFRQTILFKRISWDFPKYPIVNCWPNGWLRF